MQNVHQRVRQLSADVARKIAAGEVIDRPNAIVRELMDNAVDSGATDITVEIFGGGIEKIRVIDNGCGMTQEDLQACARPHATSKIQNEDDLLTLTTLGFRGEALSSMAAVSRLEIISGGHKLTVSLQEDHIIIPAASRGGTIVQTSGLFENFPARRQFLKRAASEASLCRATFEEKTLPHTDIAFTFSVDGEQKINLPKNQSLKERFVQVLGLFESEDLFFEVSGAAPNEDWRFDLILGEPSVSRANRKNIYIYVNGRRIQEFSLVQAIEYGAAGYFPNGTHPVACLFVTMKSSLVDFNIHPAKKEARFKDSAELHKAVSSAAKNFFKQYTVKNLVEQADFSYGDLGYQTSAIPQSAVSYSKTYRNKSSALHSAVHFNSPEDQFTKDFHSASVPGRITHPNYIPTEDENDDVRFVGFALGNFLIAEKNDTLYIIDQHAAHERFLYNSIMEKNAQKQTLLVPYKIQTASAADDAYLTELSSQFEAAGFEAKHVGAGLWEFYAVPILFKGTEKDLEKDLLDRRVSPHDIINAVAASTACRTAVMDGDVLDREMATWLVKEALRLPDPHCPHGRPVYTTITRRQLFMLVKRL